MSRIKVRNGGVCPDDALFIVEAFDSTLPELEAIGSGEMWGSQPFSQKNGFLEETVKDVNMSEKYRLTGEGDALRVFIAEVAVGGPAGFPAMPHAHRNSDLRYREANDGTIFLSVGAAMVREDWLPGHIKSQFHAEDIRTELEGREDFVYLDVMVTDYRAGNCRHGVGKALIRRCIEYGIEKGKSSLYVEAWAGNNRKLVRYYEQRGFSTVGEYSMRRSNGTTWLGTLLRMDLAG
ncbi:hypothetical protein CCHL11_05889 [Colletotrichum chlorophyti]|uniref:N-acetyltransferase domain-containing protein n=1 Tax=Colletotrichum chlorophyti TaxID=708187 RepID=A0A1Q8RJ61_9PEZI|nr:hypothetical protein CCHL11_05889 [Colletotrichum chlorophyti]